MAETGWGPQSRTRVQEFRDNPDFSRNGRSAYQGTGYNSFEELSDNIANGIFKINGNVSNLERSLRALGTDRDNIQLRDKIHDTQQVTNRVVSDLAANFKRLSGLRRDREQRLQFERLSQQFKEVTQRYSGLQKMMRDKIQSTTPKQALKPLVDFGADDDEAALVAEEGRRQQQMQEEAALEQDMALVREREERLRQLEGDILDVNEIFKDLSALVHEQGETIDTIEENVEQGHQYVESGNEQLVKAVEYQRKARRKKCCLAVVCVVVVAVIIIIIVISVKTHHN